MVANMAAKIYIFLIFIVENASIIFHLYENISTDTKAANQTCLLDYKFKANSTRNWLSYSQLQLLSSKCLPVLRYGLNSCPANVTELRSLEHPVTMAFMKIFNTNSIDIVSYCPSAFGFHSVREQVLRRKINFLAKLKINVRTRCVHLYLLTEWLACYYCCAHSSVHQRIITIN